MVRRGWKPLLLFALAAYLCLLGVLAPELGGTPVSADTPITYTGEQLYQKYGGSVFYIRVLRSDGTQKTYGSGFLIGNDGLALTAAHVVSQAEGLEVELDNGLLLKGVSILYPDTVSDVAVLKLPNRIASGQVDYDVVKQWSAGQGQGVAVKTAGNTLEITYPAIPVAKEASRQGAMPWSVGYPMKSGKMMTDGVVASPTMTINGKTRMLITSLLTNGMSGGVVMNQYGEAVGINLGIITSMGGVGYSPTMEQIKLALAACS